MQDESRKKDAIFDNQDALLEVWKVKQGCVDSYQSMMWTNAEYFFITISALISINFVGLGTAASLESTLLRSGILLFFPILSSIVIILSWLGRDIAKHRFVRVLEAIAHIAKLEGILGLDADIQNRLEEAGIFQDDTYLSQRHIESRRHSHRNEPYRSEKQWVTDKIESSDTPYGHLSRVYIVMASIGILLMIFDLSLFVMGLIGII